MRFQWPRRNHVAPSLRKNPIASRALEMLPRLLVHAAALAVVGLVVVAAGQPLFSEDTWWHLGMGEEYATSGPWLDQDPFLHTAPGPPAPAAWLADLALYGVERAAGFQGLRVVGALWVAAILGVGWSLLRRASGSAAFASLATALFSALSAYRLFQLRPHLVSMLAMLLLYRLLIADGRPPSRGRIAAAALLLALWANAHGAFVLGPILLGAALAGLLVSAWLRPARRGEDLARARSLAAALGLGLVATLANPAGAGPHLLYFSAGHETPALALVADEWAPVRLFAWPRPNLPPSPLAWAVLWALLLATPCAVFWQERWHRRRGAAPAFDPAAVALAAAAFVGLLSAVRLLWLAIFPLLVLGASARALRSPRDAARPAIAWAAALAALLLVPGFLRIGDWPMISKGIQRETWGRPYQSVKYYAHAVWFLRDAGIEGNLWNDYSAGNFLGYWLAPSMRVFVNGSLNVPAELMRARRAILARGGGGSGDSFLDLLERWKIDVFFGTGVPVLPNPGRPVYSTTTHLEGATGWIPLFRNLRSAVSLRDDPRNRANLERTAAYYAREGVPFDPSRGFDAERVIEEAPRWAVDHGLLPVGFEALERASRALQRDRRRAARGRLAAVYATLGLYERAAGIDRRLLRENPGTLPVARRLVWSLLHLGRGDEALVVAEQLAGFASPDDELSRLTVGTARRYPTLGEDEADAWVAGLPLFTRPQMQWVLNGFRESEARVERR